jgi:hypothetical protein
MGAFVFRDRNPRRRALIPLSLFFINVFLTFFTHTILLRNFKITDVTIWILATNLSSVISVLLAGVQLKIIANSSYDFSSARTTKILSTQSRKLSILTFPVGFLLISFGLIHSLNSPTYSKFTIALGYGIMMTPLIYEAIVKFGIIQQVLNANFIGLFTLIVSSMQTLNITLLAYFRFNSIINLFWINATIYLSVVMGFGKKLGSYNFQKKQLSRVLSNSWPLFMLWLLTTSDVLIGNWKFTEVISGNFAASSTLGKATLLISQFLFQYRAKDFIATANFNEFIRKSLGFGKTMFWLTVTLILSIWLIPQEAFIYFFGESYLFYQYFAMIQLIAIYPCHILLILTQFSIANRVIGVKRLFLCVISAAVFSYTIFGNSPIAVSSILFLTGSINSLILIKVIKSNYKKTEIRYE